MNKIKFATVAIALSMVAGTTWFYRRADGKEVSPYRTAPIAQATLKSTVSATGALSAVRTVQVGTQVSGQLAKIYVDFNDKVKKGQLLATIDPTLQRQAVEDAQAQLERADAQLKQAQDDYARNKTLFDARVITAAEFSTVQSNFSVQTATVKSAQIALDRAKQNLAYTSIYAPIDGVIVERNVDVGQTVAASLSAPQLFLIANDLSEMQILASVDESDIGMIKEGQPVQFTVQSYPNQTFVGTVKQVRLQSTTTDNVVNYTAVVAVSNASGKLLPGMTATVQFTIGTANDVLAVPNAALRIRATPEMYAAVGQTAPGTGAATRTGTDVATPAGTNVATPAGTNTTTQSATATQAARPSGQTSQGAGARVFGGAGQGAGTRAFSGGTRGASNHALLWYLDAQGTLHATPVQTGMSDGQKTEVKGQGLSAGLQVVTAVLSDAATGAPAATPTAATSPFQPARGGGGRRGY